MHIVEDTYEDSAAAVGVCLAGNVPCLLWGPPGNGKTSVIGALAKSLGMHMETVIPSIYQPSDFNGMPYVNESTKSMTLFAPDWAQRVKAAADAEGSHGAIVFYDEISTAPEATQAALLRPILEGVVGELQLPRSVRTVAAANPPEQAAGGWDLPLPAANRFVHLNWALSPEVIRAGFSGNWPVISVPVFDPAVARAERRRLLMTFGIFITTRPDYATAVPTSSDEAGRGWPSPRSWDMLAKVWGVASAANLPESVIGVLARGCVGRAAANEIITYVANLDLPDPEALLANPDSFDVPAERSDIVFAVCASVEDAVRRDPAPGRWLAAGEVLRKVCEVGHQDIAVGHGNRWLEMRPDGVMPSPGVMHALAPILKQMSLLASA